MATIPRNEVASRRQVGRHQGKPVWAVSAIGGIHTIAVGNDPTPVGAGNHAALARHVAKMSCPGIEFDALEKSEYVPYAAIADLIPEAAELTRQLQIRCRELFPR